VRWQFVPANVTRDKEFRHRCANLAMRPKPFFKAGNEMFSEAVETLEVLVAKGRTPSLSRHAA
jgi:hypothetical protein